METTITVYGAYWCPDCRQSKHFLSEHQIAYDWVDIEQHDEGRAYVEKLNNGKRIIPTITFPKESGILVDDYGYILTGHQLARHPEWQNDHEPALLETSMLAVFAAGDARAGSTKQVAAAAGEGATAALLIREYLNEI